jgi:hypothetical protein
VAIVQGIQSGIRSGPLQGMDPSAGAPMTVTHRLGFSSTANVTTYTSGSFTIPANELGLLWVLSAKTAGPDAPTFGGTLGGTWTQIGSGVVIDADRTLRCYRSLQGSSRTGTLSIIHATLHESCAIQVLSLQGCDQSGSNGSGAIVQSLTGAVTAGTALSVSLSAFADARNVCAGAIGGDVNNQTTNGGGFTEWNEQGQAALDIRLQVQSAAGLNVCPWTFGSRDAAAIVVEIKAL